MRPGSGMMVGVEEVEEEEEEEEKKRWWWAVLMVPLRLDMFYKYFYCNSQMNFG